MENERGSWGNRESIDWFLNFAKVMFENFGDRVKYWLTINEQNVLILSGDIIGTTTLTGPEKYKSLYRRCFKCAGTAPQKTALYLSGGG